MMRAIIGAVGAWLLLSSTGQAQDVGECAWRTLSDEVRQSYVTAYGQSMKAASDVLAAHESAVRSAVTQCAGVDHIPVLWMDAAVGSTAIQDGAADQLQASSKISPSTLAATWDAAPADAKQCTRANAAKIFGLMNEPCPDPKSPLWFLQALKLSPTTDRSAASQALIYFNAKAQSEWAGAAIDKFKSMRK